MASNTGRRYNWATLDPLLLELYAQPPARGRLAAFRQQHALSRHAMAYRRRHLQHQGTLPDRTAQPWSATELAALQHDYGRVPIDVLAQRFHRSRSALKRAALRYGLGPSADWNLTAIAEALGCSHTAVSNWVHRGWLRAALTSRAGARSRGLRYGCSDQALHNFLLDYPHVWQRFPCPDRAWLDSLIAARDLRRPQDPPVPRQVRPAAPRRIPGLIEYGGPRSRRPSAREHYR